MASKEIDSKAFAKLVVEVKKDLKQGGGQVVRSERELSEASGIPMAQIGKAIYAAELQADPSLKIAQTTKAVVAAKNGGMRWPRIAVRAGISAGKVQALYAESGVKPEDAPYSGRGRKSFDGAPREQRARGVGSSKKTAATRGTSGRRTRSSGTATKKTAAASGTARRRGTRAQAGADPK